MHQPITEISAEGVFILQNGRVKECNNFLVTQAGYGMDEIEGTCFASFFERDSIPTVEAVCGQMPALHRPTSPPRALLLCKNGDGLEVRLRADSCLFDGSPAVRVTLTVLGGRVSDRTPDADLDCFLVSEERLTSQPACC